MDRFDRSIRWDSYTWHISQLCRPNLRVCFHPVKCGTQFTVWNTAAKCSGTPGTGGG
ncbi:hypothetical protein GBA52_005309 [Prunus armeniaca]|nr:hypothetical protein GBA52_005309 [Prunus armeniaca]